MTDVDVTDNPEQHRYEARIADELAGFAAYRLRGRDVIVFTHTEVDPAHEGKGIGGALARGALDDVRARGERRVVALCPFIAKWIAKHPDYENLLAS
jgi:predicted GNAT family acetyltransferase